MCGPASSVLKPDASVMESTQIPCLPRQAFSVGSCSTARTKKGRRERDFPGGLLAGSFSRGPLLSQCSQQLANLPRCGSPVIKPVASSPPVVHPAMSLFHACFLLEWMAGFVTPWKLTSPFVPSFPCTGASFRWKSVLQPPCQETKPGAEKSRAIWGSRFAC